MNASVASSMRIGEVAARAAVNVQTLRYYERRGLLPTPRRRPSGYREYPIDTVRMVRFIKRAQELGFNLRDIRELIDLRSNRAGNRVEVRALAAAKAHDIAARISRLTAMRQALQELVDACHCDGCTPSCPIIEALDDAADA